LTPVRENHAAAAHGALGSRRHLVGRDAGKASKITWLARSLVARTAWQCAGFGYLMNK